MTRTEQNTFYFKRHIVHILQTLSYISYNTRGNVYNKDFY